MGKKLSHFPWKPLEGYHPLQLGHQETFSRVGSQGSQLTASVFEGIMEMSERFFWV